MKLDKTIDMMLHDDYADQLRAEYHQLTYRTNKLQQLVTAIKKGEKKPPVGCSKYLLMWQLKNMKEYKEILELRATCEGIALNEVK